MNTKPQRRVKHISFSFPISLFVMSLLLGAFLACKDDRSKQEDFHVDITNQTQIQQIGPGREGSGDQSGKTRSPKIPLREGETLLGLYSLNVDDDAEEEQICILKRRDDSSSFIRVAVLDQKSSSGSWQRIWDGATLATKFPTFSLSVKDMLGTHELDIIASGMNDSGRQTLSIYHPLKGSTSQADQYRLILGIEADAIEIQEIERPEAYALGMATGIPWMVLSYDQDQVSENYLDQVETSWLWNPSQKSFERGQSKNISGSKIEQKIVERYLNRDSATFERFLTGIWYLNSGDGKATKESRIIHFDPENRSIAFSESGDLSSLSVFTWNDSQATKLGIFISTHNTGIDSMKRFLDVELRGPDSISLRIIEDIYIRADPGTLWNGTYRKYMPSSLKQESANEPKALSGRFSIPGGAQVVFSPPRFSWKTADIETQGVFSQYSMGAAIVIIFKTMKASGVITSSQTYKIERREKKDSSGVYEEITLRPARTTVQGLELLDQDPIILEQLR